MKPKGFDYLKVTSVGEATEALARGGEDVRLIAGGECVKFVRFWSVIFHE